MSSVQPHTSPQSEDRPHGSVERNSMSTVFARPAVRRGAAVVGAGVAALVLWAGSGGDPVVRAADGGEQHVGAAAVVVTAVLAGLAGWALLTVLERVTRRAFRIWLAVATTVFLLSLLPAAGAAVGAHSVGTLLGLHTIVFAVLVAGFRRTRVR